MAKQKGIRMYRREIFRWRVFCKSQWKKRKCSGESKVRRAENTVLETSGISLDELRVQL